MVNFSSLELSKSSHLLKTDIFEDFFNNDKLRKVNFLVALQSLKYFVLLFDIWCLKHIFMQRNFFWNFMSFTDYLDNQNFGTFPFNMYNEPFYWPTFLFHYWPGFNPAHPDVTQWRLFSMVSGPVGFGL